MTNPGNMREQGEASGSEALVQARAALSIKRERRAIADRGQLRMSGLAAGTLLSIPVLFLINTFIIVNPALFGILMIGAAMMGSLSAPLVERKLWPERAQQRALRQRYLVRLQAIEQAMRRAELPATEVPRKVLEAREEYEASREQLFALGGKHPD